MRAENSHQAVSPAHREGSRCLGRAHCLALGSQNEKHGKPCFSTSEEATQTAGPSLQLILSQGLCFLIDFKPHGSPGTYHPSAE